MKSASLKPISFGEDPGPEPYNASEIVAIADSRFLFCDNNIGDGLFELQLAADGGRSGVHDPCAIGGSRLLVRIPFVQLETAKEAPQEEEPARETVPR